jgi:quinol monooxygenase YgiN
MITKDGLRDALVEPAEKSIAVVVQEPGCLSYELCFSATDANKATFVEQWDSLDALKVHLYTPNLAEFVQSTEQLLAAPLSVRVFEATEISLD